MKKSAFALTFLFSCAAFAHHPLNTMPMESFSDGLLSGIGHTIIGIDHFFFVAMVGLIGLFTGHKYAAPLAYLAAMAAGCLMMAEGLNLPYKESAIAFSLLTLGLFVLAGIRVTLIPALTLFIVFGIFHGSAFGESIAANEITLDTHILCMAI